MDDGPRAYTPEEVREQFLRHVWDLVDYWSADDRARDPRDGMAGLAFSILAVLDGDAVDLPGFLVAPLPAPEDREYHVERGRNWYPEIDDDAIECDIAGGLHEHFYNYDPAKGGEG